MRRRGQRGLREGRRVGAAAASCRDHLGFVLALLVLLSQTLALPLHQMGPTSTSGPEQAAYQLKQVFGDSVVLCVQTEDGKGPAAPLDQSCAHCPLCQAGAGALAMVLPTPTAEPSRIAVVVRRLAPSSQTPRHIERDRVAAQPRGPPAEV